MASGPRAFATEESCRRLAVALDMLIAVCPAGVADVVLWAVYRFHRLGADFSLSPERWMRLRRQAWKDARAVSSHQHPHLFLFLVRMAYLDRSLIFQHSIETIYGRETG